MIVVDPTKLSPALGTGFPLPIAVIPFAARLEREYLESLGAKVKLRGGDRRLPPISLSATRMGFITTDRARIYLSR